MNLRDPVSSVMAVDLPTVSADTAASALCERFRTSGLHHLPVVDDDGILLGILSHVDLFKARGDDVCAADLMAEAPAVVHPDDPVAVAVAALAEGAFHALPVLDEDGGLRGLLTTSGLLRRLLAEHGVELYALPAEALTEGPAEITLEDDERLARYEEVRARLDALLAGQADVITSMATVACELHHAFDYFDWTGFYRAVGDGILAVGPYQGPHGCLQIEIGRGVCGIAAATGCSQRVADVRAFPDAIPCAPETRSELAVPVLTPGGTLLGVLDVDSDAPDAFSDADRVALEAICEDLGRRLAEA